MGNFKYIIAVIIGAILLISISPKIFIPLLIILIIFYKQILQLINKFMPMGQTFDYAKVVGDKVKLGSTVIIGVIIAVILIIILSGQSLLYQPVQPGFIIYSAKLRISRLVPAFI